MPISQADELKLTLRMYSDKIAGFVKDGVYIGEGRVTSNEDHTGVQVWSDAVHSGTQPNKYVMMGNGDGNHKLNIRIENDGWKLDAEGNNGITKDTKDSDNVFYVVVDGDQMVSADSYTIRFASKILSP